MTGIASQIAQLLGNGGTLFSGGKKGIQNLEDGILANNATDLTGFQNLLASFGISGIDTAQLTAKAAASATNGEKQDPAALLAGLLTNPELVKKLESLTPEDLTALAALQGQTTTAVSTDNGLLAVLDALSKLDVTDTEKLYDIVKDPNLAAALADLTQKIQTLQAQGELAPETPFAGALQAALAKTQQARNTSNVLPDDVATRQDLTSDQLPLQSTAQQTVTVADLTPDEFNAFKKLAYTDIAPFLTSPRLVRIDGNTVARIAQGPAFLNDDSRQDTALNLLSGLVPALVATAQTAQTGQNAPATLPAALQNIQANLAALAARHTASESANTGKTATGFDLAAMLQGDALSTEQLAQGSAGATGIHPSLLAAMTSGNAQTRGFSAVATGLDNALADPVTFDLPDGFNTSMAVHADQNSPAGGTMTLMLARSAAGLHPTTHLVSAALQNATVNATLGIVDEKQFVLQLDPPSLGRLKITLEFADNNTVKAKILAERPETVSLLQKDANLLAKSLQNSGFDANPGAITFDLAQDNSFSHNGGGESRGENSDNAQDDDFGTEFAKLETVMPVFVDPYTGLTHVNVVI